MRDIEREILELTDEDYYGLWEIGWRLSSALNLDASRNPEQAAVAILSLQRQGVVQIYVRERIDAAPVPLASSGRTIDLYDPSAWCEPKAGQPEFLIGSAQ